MIVEIAGTDTNSQNQFGTCIYHLLQSITRSLFTLSFFRFLQSDTAHQLHEPRF